MMLLALVLSEVLAAVGLLSLIVGAIKYGLRRPARAELVCGPLLWLPLAVVVAIIYATGWRPE